MMPRRRRVLLGLGGVFSPEKIVLFFLSCAGLWLWLRAVWRIQAVIFLRPLGPGAPAVSQTKNPNLVPRIIHQTYKTEVLPENFKAWREECKILNPGWEFKLWTDESNLDLVSTYYPELLSMYQGYDVNIKRVDAARYMMLHKYGGVYMDMDLTCLRGFNESTFARENTFYAARQHPKGGDEAQRVANAFMASTPGHPFLSKILAALNGTKDYHVIVATGPAFLTSLIDGEKGEGMEENDEEKVTVVVDQENGSIVEFPIEAMFSVPFYATTEIEMCAANRTECSEKYHGYLFSFWTHTWLH